MISPRHPEELGNGTPTKLGTNVRREVPVVPDHSLVKRIGSGSYGKVLYEMASGKDRNHFPEPPTLLKDLPDREGFQELKEVILKACAHDAQQRYQSAAEMQAELVSLRAGKSLKRSRLLEKRLALLTKLSAVGIAPSWCNCSSTSAVPGEWILVRTDGEC